jgi:hypothetical protein
MMHSVGTPVELRAVKEYTTPSTWPKTAKMTADYFQDLEGLVIIEFDSLYMVPNHEQHLEHE